ncbi:MAG: DHHA1 domain-containing protein, partial [Acidaminococcaceae bacterium]|nr:DHHA1 domain-containing protein [Acidaminococcaceae bacterium]
KDVKIEELPIEEAKKKGAMALFGEKYGKIVRVVTVPDFSMEFCGGTHVSNTAQIGMFKILSESSSGAGVRRIEAVTGHGATEYVKNMELALKNIAADLKCRVDDIPNRLDSLHDELKEIHKKVDELSGAMAKSQLGDVLAKVQEFNGVKVLVQKVHADNMDALRNLGDQLRDKVGGAVVLATEMEGKAVILAMAVKDAVAKGIHSGNIVKELAKLCGGGGGGKPDMAQAGAKDLAKLDDALKNAWEIVKKQIKS